MSTAQQWRYLPSSRCVIVDEGDDLRFVAQKVAPEDGAVIVVAPLMEAFIRDVAKDAFVGERYRLACLILAKIDEAREKA